MADANRMTVGGCGEERGAPLISIGASLSSSCIDLIRPLFSARPFFADAFLAAFAVSLSLS